MQQYTLLHLVYTGQQSDEEASADKLYGSAQAPEVSLKDEGKLKVKQSLFSYESPVNAKLKRRVQQAYAFICFYLLFSTLSTS
jgi:hypothetical protein